MRNRKRLYSIIISSVVLAGFLLTSLIGYFVAKDSISQRLQREMLPLTSDNIYSEIQRDLLQPLLISSLMANDAFVFDWANAGEQDPKKMQNYLALIQHRYGTITAFFVSEATRNYYHPDGIIKQVSADDENDDWFFRTRALQAPYEINIDQDTADSSRISIFVNYRVEDKQGQFLGVIGVGLAMNSVAELIENYQQRYGREIYFVNRQGEVMLQSSQYSDEIHIQNKAGLDKLFTRILTSPSASVSYEAKNGHTIYINSRIVPEFDWYLIVEQINDPTSEKIEGALWVNLAVSLAISILVLIIAHFSLRGYQGRLEVMATKDKLTGTVNRQIFESLFEQAEALAKRRQQKLSLVLFDIDYFKQINDNFGHRAGDRVLIAVAELIQSYIREEDVLCRWGGEEFVLMLQDCNLEKAQVLIENIRHAIERTSFHFSGKTVSVTVSAGLAEYHRSESLASVIDRADTALYQAKNEGRNRIKSSL